MPPVDGYVRTILLDVRVVPEYENEFILDSVNVPLYRAIEGWSAAANVRRAAFAFFGSMGSGTSHTSLTPQNLFKYWCSTVLASL